MAIRVAVVQSESPSSEELKRLLSAQERFVLAGHWQTCAEALDHLPGAHPDIVLIDLACTERAPALALIARIKHSKPDIGIMLLAECAGIDLACACLFGGGTASIFRESCPKSIVESLFELANGSSPLAGGIARALIERIHLSQKTSLDLLTHRETEILAALAGGRRYKEIAASFRLSAHTVRTHLHRIYRKLNVPGKAAAIRIYRSAKR